jgi:hypothetical protein
MKTHPKDWLQAYYDGQLNPKRTQMVAEHLAQCEQCQEALSELQSISFLLQESPAASNLLSSEIFVSQVGMRLPRKAVRPGIHGSLEAGWRLAPFGMLAAWAFVQAVFIVASLLLAGLRLIPGAGPLLAILPAESASLSAMTSMQGLSLLEVGQFGRQIIGGSGPLGLAFSLNVGLTILIGMLYLSWLASWWIRNQNYHYLETDATLQQ